MKSWAERRLTQEIRKIDPKLFIKQDFRGVPMILRESFQHQPYLVDNAVIHALIPAHHFIIALTHNWTASGEPVEWGIEPVVRRLREIDSWNDQSFINRDLEKHNQKVDESQQREINNKLEAAVYDSLPVFKKTFADVNTANLDKLDKRKIKGV